MFLFFRCSFRLAQLVELVELIVLLITDSLKYAYRKPLIVTPIRPLSRSIGLVYTSTREQRSNDHTRQKNLPDLPDYTEECRLILIPVSLVPGHSPNPKVSWPPNAGIELRVRFLLNVYRIAYMPIMPTVPPLVARSPLVVYK